MAVPTSGNFEMFGTGSTTSIAGALNSAGDNVNGLTTFTQLINVSTAGKFNFTYAGEVTHPPSDINQTYQFRGYPVDPGNCRAIWVDDTVNQSRYGARYRLPSGQEKNTLYGSLFGSPYTYGGNSGTVYNVCSTLVPSTWDSVTQTIVDLGGLVVNFADGGNCYINTECEWIEPTPTPTPTATNTPTPTPTNTNTPTPTPVTYYYQLAHCTDGPSNSIYVYSVGTQITNGDSFSYFSNCYEYYDVDPGQTGTIDLAGLSTCVCATPTPTPTNTPTPTPTPVTYYYQLAHCNDGPSNSIYVFSVGNQITNGDSFSYNSNCYEYYDVDPGQIGTINLAGLSTCVCATPTPTPTNTPTPTPTPVTYYYQLAHCNDGPSNSIYVYSVGTQITNGDSFSYFGNCYEYYDVDPGQTGTINLAGLSTCVCATPTPTPTPTPVTYYYQLAHCTDGPSNSIYVFSVGNQITNGDSFSYNSNCYEYYDVDPGQTGTINLAGLSTCVCVTPTPTPIPVDPNCEFIFVPNTESTVDRGLRYNNGGEINTPFSSLFGVPSTEGGVNGVVYGVCTTTVPQWLVVSSNVTTAFPSGTYHIGSGGTCSINTPDCQWSPSTPTPTPTGTPTPTPTPTDTPTPACPSETLGEGATSNDACNDFAAATGTVRYMDGPFAFATVIYRNSDCGPAVASAQYFSDGTIWRYWNGSAFTSDGVCPNY